MERVFRIAAAAAQLGVGPNTVYRLIHSGDLAAVQIMRGILGIKQSELERYIESRPQALPNAAKVAAALASPAHGRAGRSEVREGSPDVA